MEAPHSGDFARLTPDDDFTICHMQWQYNVNETNASASEHHRKFLRYKAVAETSPSNPVPSLTSPTAYPPMYKQHFDKRRRKLMRLIPCFVVNLARSRRPAEPWRGWQIGVGSSVDLLLPPVHSNATLPPSSLPLYAQQGLFEFGLTHGRLQLRQLPNELDGIHVDGDPCIKGLAILTNGSKITIGPFTFVFDFIQSDEDGISKLLQSQLKSMKLDPQVLLASCSTKKELRIGGFVLHGDLLETDEIFTLHPASHPHSPGNLSQFQLFRDTERQTANDAYTKALLSGTAVAEALSASPYQVFVKLLHLKFMSSVVHDPEKKFLVWFPLAGGSFEEFQEQNLWPATVRETKDYLFVQCLLGMKALHDNGLVLKCLSPENLQVVNCIVPRDTLHAFLGPHSDIVPEHRPFDELDDNDPDYRAPEITCKAYGPTLEHCKSSNIWSMGAVAHFYIFGRPPGTDAKKLFANLRSGALVSKRAKDDTFECVIGKMLAEDPSERPTIDEILKYRCVSRIKEAIDQNLPQ